MMNYQRKQDDVAYRKIQLSSESVPGFVDFQGGQSISYNEEAQVLEVKKENGTTEIIYDGPKRTLVMSITDSGAGSRVVIDAGIPTARLWVQAGGAMYKVPSKLPSVDNNNNYFDMKLRSREYTITGDKYFNAVYSSR